METAPSIIPASPADALALTDLINRAYRGPATTRNWTTEAQLFDGPRIDVAHVAKMICTSEATLLKYVSTSGLLLGCVYLEPKGRHLYLGTLAVAPEDQAQGVGRQLLAAAEEHARRCGCTRVLMSVLSARPELLAWYERHGYQRTGKSEPFPATTQFGQPRQPLVLLELAKQVATTA